MRRVLPKRNKTDRVIDSHRLLTFNNVLVHHRGWPSGVISCERQQQQQQQQTCQSKLFKMMRTHSTPNNTVFIIQIHVIPPLFISLSHYSYPLPLTRTHKNTLPLSSMDTTEKTKQQKECSGGVCMCHFIFTVNFLNFV